jgi:FKBP-type peptidyl-prolyl cis-trans isomerase
MQIKTIGTSLATKATFALILACASSSAAPTANATAELQPALKMTISTQDGDIPAPADVAGPPADATKTASGLAYKVLTAGTGTERPTAADDVTVNYTGWTTDGKMFDSSITRGRPATFPLGQVISGWTEGLQLMSIGEKTRFWIPEELAYRGGDPKGLLVFDVELLAIKAKVPAPTVPKDLNAPPATAVTTASGLKIQTLRKGTGTEKPGPSDQVTVNYSGWTTDGTMFDSSVASGQPATFSLAGVIPGWTEGLQHLVVGEKARFWIPEALAYDGRPGAPAGMLVFDVELMKIVKAPQTPDNLKNPPADAVTTASGLILHTMKAGDASDLATNASALMVHFSFWDQEGKMFQSSRMSGRPVPMDMQNTPLPGLTEALKLLSAGQSVRLWVPEALAFKGEEGTPAGTIVFDIEVIRVFNAPANVAMAPADAIRLDSGLAYKVVKANADPAAKKPMADSTVIMHYTGFTPEGKLFDCSYFQGDPGTFRVDSVMPGWTEGLQLMKAGEHYRFWIPKALGIGARQGAPPGDVVFDVELISIK